MLLSPALLLFGLDACLSIQFFHIVTSAIIGIAMAFSWNVICDLAVWLLILELTKVVARIDLINTVSSCLQSNKEPNT